MASSPLPSGPRFALVQTYRLMTDPYRYYAAMRDRHGPEYIVPALNGLVLVVTTPEAVKEVFTAPAEHFSVFGGETLGPVLGASSVITLAGEPHKRARKLLTPPFHGARMRTYGEAMREVARSALSRLRPGEPMRAHDLTRKISLEVILRTVFGVEGALGDATRAHLESALGGFSPIYLFSRALQQRFMPGWRRFLEAREGLSRLVRDAVDARRSEGPDADRSSGRQDILAMLAHATYDDGSSLSYEEITSHLLTLLVAGHETTAIALAWSMYWLARHPEAHAKLRAELDANEGADPETTAKLPYLSAVCDESLRLNTILPDPVRLLAQPLTVRGHALAPGMGICLATDVIHQDPSIYPEPTRFRPERFLDKKPSPFEFFPFGGGHRRCIGAAFSDFEQRLALAEVMRSGDFRLVHDDPERAVRRNVTMGPARGVPMVFTPRL